jgi:TRAP-type C4-dicarboxylate transport system permease small subunit
MNGDGRSGQDAGERPALAWFLIGANRWAERLENVGGILAAVSIFAMMAIVFVDVFLRYFLRSPLSWSYDLISLYLVPIVFFFVLSETFRKDNHIAVDLLYLRLPGFLRRIARLVIAVLTIPVFLDIVMLSLKDADQAYRNNEVLSGAILWPTWIPLVVVALGCGLLVLRLALDAVALLVALAVRSQEVDGESPPRRRSGSHEEAHP